METMTRPEAAKPEVQRPNSWVEWNARHRTLDKNRTGLILGTFLGLFHAVWSLIVATGAAQSLMDLIFWLHFLADPFQVQQFSGARALGLVVVTSAIGYAMGWVFAYVWNYFQYES